MDGPREHYAKWNKPVKERQIPYDFTHKWNLTTNLTNKQNRERLIDGEQEDGWGGGGHGVKGLSKKEKGLTDMDHTGDCRGSGVWGD